ncbi:MAG: DUF86 domain-containing protein [Clostridia bacterium]|nr:DUF86 domain-containing protein [Clostridia bacterium]MBQ6722259.1 DUF86 domain-containing protein [Clostridia bacterium]
MTQRDSDLLNHIIRYCEKAKSYLARCENGKDQFMRDSMCQDACCMCIAQIGELSGLLSDDLKNAHPELPWRAIKDTRNFYVHNYGSVNMEYVWNTLTEDLPILQKVCESIIQKK